jgi:V-type H+-transporting ATPase subunit d
MSSEQENKRELYESQNIVRREGPIGGLLTFNAEFGYLEAVLRGFKSGFLRDNEYRQLCNCDNLEDVKLTLGDTDFLNVLQSQAKLTPDIIANKCRDKFVGEFLYLRSQAVGQLSTFLEFVTYEYLIHSISLIISSLIKGANVEDLLHKCHPLGRSPHLKAMMTFENFEKADGLVELYRTVLVDTPVAPYFEKYFNSEIKGDSPGREIQKVYNEVEIDIIENMIQKLCLEDFYAYTQTLGGETAAIMKELLEFEADRRAINITLNSFNSNLNDPHNRNSERKQLYCTFGKLYPEATLTTFSKVSNPQQLAQALAPYKIYNDMATKSDAELRSLPDDLLAYEVHLNRQAFDSQSHFAAFYGFVKLKQQEERNLRHILNCIDQRRDPKEIRWVNIFKS